MDVRASATEPQAALAALEEHLPDLFLTEIENEPSHVGDWVRAARERAPNVRVVILSTHQDPRFVDSALAGGAVAYVFKTTHPDDLGAAVRQAFELSMYFAGARPATQPASAPVGDASDLTRRELEILRLVAHGKSNAQVARELWVTEQTVKFHLSNIYRKLDVANRTEASRWAQVRGLLEESERGRV